MGILHRLHRTQPPAPTPAPEVPTRAQAAMRLRAALVAESAAIIANAAIADLPRPTNRVETVARAEVVVRSLGRVERARAERRAAGRALDALQDDALECRAFAPVEDRRGEPWALASNPLAQPETRP